MCQPASLINRRSAEHWAGRLYMRRLSLHVTRQLLTAPVTPNGLTVGMIFTGLLAALVLTLPSFWSAVVAAFLVQLYLLLDCVDGEVARWRGVTTATGVFLDRLGHYAVEAALLVGLGVRAQGGLTTTGGYATVGAVGAVLLLLSKAETDLVTLSRVSAQLGLAAERDPTPRPAVLSGLRAVAGRVPFHRLIGGVELSLGIVLVAIVDAARGDLLATRALVVGASVVAAIVALGHAIAIVTSERLR